jgi:hypothetical protein
MTLTSHSSASETPPSSASGIVDCDTHNYWNSPDELWPFISRRWRDHMETYGTRRFAGSDYPRFWREPEERIPISGKRTGADVEFMGVDHLDRHGIAYAVLIPMSDVSIGIGNLSLAEALAQAVNDWQAARWLDVDSRLRASLVVSAEDAPAAVKEIERRVTDRRFVQVQFSGRTQEPMGRRKYWPIYEACEANGLPVMTHAFGASGNPITGAGWPSYYLEDHGGPPFAMQANIASLVMEGAFIRFPELRIVSVENGFGWVPSFVARMDRAWHILGGEVPHVTCPPSKYIAENVYFTTQPVEEPDRSRSFGRLFDEFPAFRDRLMFSSDYPHWDMDAPDRALPMLHDSELREHVLHRNARTLYGLS